MQGISYALIFLFFNLFLFASAETDWEATMIADVVHAMERPSSVIAKVCWPIFMKARLYATLTNGTKNIATLQFLQPDHLLPKYDQNQHIVFLADLSCPYISDYLKKSNDEKYFSSPFRWILINKFNNYSAERSVITSNLEDFDIFPDSEVIVAQPLGNWSYDFYLIYKVSAATTWRTEYYGSWNTKNRFIKNHQLVTSIASRRLNLYGHTISVCYVIMDNDSINHLTDGINDHKDTITKVNVATVSHLLDLLNASRKYVFVDSWGYKINGSWTGLTGHLIRKEVEIGGSPMFFTSERIAIVDFISSPTPSLIRFIFQQPKLSYTNNLFLLSFKSSVWYSLLVLVFLMFLALLAVATWESKRNKDKTEMMTDARILRGDVKDVAMVIFGAACQQGSPVELKGSLGRVVMLVLFLTLMFLYTSYSANIVALLQSSSSQIKTLEDLLHSRIKLGVHDTVYNRYYFSTATEPIRKAIYQTKIAPPGKKPQFMSMNEGIKNMQKGLFAFHVEIGVGYKFVSKYFREGEKCSLQEIEYLQMLEPYQAVQKDTPYKELFKIGFKRMKEHGLQIRENLRMYEKKPKCSGRESHFISVSMVDCYPALLVLAYGIGIAVVLLFLEIICHKRQQIANICRNKRNRLNEK